MKVCKKCHKSKSYELYHKNFRLKDGFQPICKECLSEIAKYNYLKNKEYSKKYKEINKEKNKVKLEEYKIKWKKEEEIKKEKNPKIILEENNEYQKFYSKNYREKNKEYFKEYTHKNKFRMKELNKRWRENNKGYNTKYINNRREKDVVFKFSINVRSLISNAFSRGKNQYKKNAKTETILGCTIEEFINYISAQFKKGMSFDNHGEWHLDHIIPIATAQSEEDIIRLNHYTNFQPLWWDENIKKGAKIIQKQLFLL